MPKHRHRHSSDQKSLGWGVHSFIVQNNFETTTEQYNKKIGKKIY